MGVPMELSKEEFEMAEGECDARIAEEACEEYLKSGKQSRPIGELRKELGL